MEGENVEKDEEALALRRDAQAWLLLLTSGHATADDAEAFRRWCSISDAHARAFAETRVLWDNLAPAARRQADVSRRHLPRARMSRRAFLGSAVAASAAAFVLLRSPWSPLPGWNGQAPDWQTGTGEQRRVQLHDVVIEMNTQTAMSLLPGGSGVELLRGEALVSTLAHRASRFLVTAGSGEVMAGSSTSCNVRCLDEGVQVTCLDGDTRLAFAGRTAVVKPSQQVDVDSAGIGIALAVNTEVAMAWRHRVLIFDSEPLSSVIDDINRYRPGKIIVTNSQLASRKVHARFSLDQLSNVTRLIHDAYGAHVTELPGGVTLLS
ncbi:ferric-dicitrate binding protein FerR (iron transport regulator) [Luteibacter sp. Sphag1AF]|uniref:FecR family protein n=1 Tax=Luteibacter sp. Sphag1AF TaxID=2587031 RepID=UPI00161376A1|nr:DUF4880 domain-containing protein [Luteibacter sp. Sphag1AF]MBB3227631.1 ferric-dicitrate binding protein FerR (iron transport regulator) [Luteibacter sp. Sphag1AF]